METGNASAEEGIFGNIAETRQADANMASAGIYASRLNVVDNKVIGPALGLKVSPNDTVKISVKAIYADAIETGSGLFNFADEVTQAFGLVDGGVTQSAYAALTSLLPASGNYHSFSNGFAVPDAYLTYHFFDRDHNYLRTGFAQISSAAEVGHELLTLQLNADQSGFVYIYVANEERGDIDVFFDDLEVINSTYTDAEVLQGEDYYPGGLTYNSYQHNITSSQNYLYQGKELQKETGLYDFDWRMYDPAIWRTSTHDPMEEDYYNWSPYSWAGNNPLLNIDPDGQNWYSYTNDDGVESVIWKEGDAATVEIDGVKYSDIGEKYSQKLDDGSVVNYDQNEVSSIIDSETTFGDQVATDEGVRALEDAAGDMEVEIKVEVSGADKVTNFFWSWFSPEVRNAFGIEVDESLTTAPPMIGPKRGKSKSSKNPGAHKKKKQSTGKSGMDRHDKQYTHGGKKRPKNPNQRKGAERRKNKGRRQN
jgi:RHS repeat-associated protein